MIADWWFLIFLAPDLDLGETTPAKRFILSKVCYAEPFDSARSKFELLRRRGFLKGYFFFRAVGELNRAPLPVSVVREISPYVNDYLVRLDRSAKIYFEPQVCALIRPPGREFWAVTSISGIAVDDVYGFIAGRLCGSISLIAYR